MVSRDGMPLRSRGLWPTAQVGRGQLTRPVVRMVGESKASGRVAVVADSGAVVQYAGGLGEPQALQGGEVLKKETSF